MIVAAWYQAGWAHIVVGIVLVLAVVFAVALEDG